MGIEERAQRTLFSRSLNSLHLSLALSPSHPHTMAAVIDKKSFNIYFLGKRKVASRVHRDSQQQRFHESYQMSLKSSNIWVLYTSGKLLQMEVE